LELIHLDPLTTNPSKWLNTGIALAMTQAITQRALHTQNQHHFAFADLEDIISTS
jgi:hypothetical protein